MNDSKFIITNTYTTKFPKGLNERKYLSSDGINGFEPANSLIDIVGSLIYFYRPDGIYVYRRDGSFMYKMPYSYSDIFISLNCWTDIDSNFVCNDGDKFGTLTITTENGCLKSTSVTSVSVNYKPKYSINIPELILRAKIKMIIFFMSVDFGYQI